MTLENCCKSDVLECKTCDSNSGFWCTKLQIPIEFDNENDEKWPPMYKKESDRFTLSPSHFVSWVHYVLFGDKGGDVAILDLEMEELKEIGAEMRKQIKETKNYAEDD